MVIAAADNFPWPLHSCSSLTLPKLPSRIHLCSAISTTGIAAAVVSFSPNPNRRTFSLPSFMGRDGSVNGGNFHGGGGDDDDNKHDNGESNNNKEEVLMALAEAGRSLESLEGGDPGREDSGIDSAAVLGAGEIRVALVAAPLWRLRSDSHISGFLLRSTIFMSFWMCSDGHSSDRYNSSSGDVRKRPPYPHKDPLKFCPYNGTSCCNSAHLEAVSLLFVRNVINFQLSFTELVLFLDMFLCSITLPSFRRDEEFIVKGLR
nr:protein RETICULATA-RELATED 4, chloroplastic-like [Ipomoea batatas]